MRNNSGLGFDAEAPEGIKKWNWGAFWFPWIWGPCHGVFLGMLSLIPIVNFILPFYFGKNGNELAWKYRKWKDVKQFNRLQKKWSGWTWLAVLLILSGLISPSIEDYMNEVKAEKYSYEMIDILKENYKDNFLDLNDVEVLSANYSRPYLKGYLGDFSDFYMIVKADDKNVHINVYFDEGDNIEKIFIIDFKAQYEHTIIMEKL